MALMCVREDLYIDTNAIKAVEVRRTEADTVRLFYLLHTQWIAGEEIPQKNIDLVKSRIRFINGELE